MIAMNLWKSPNNTWHLWLNKSEAPPKGKRISLKQIAGHPVRDEEEAKEYLKTLQKNWHKQKIIELKHGKRHPIGKFKERYIKERSHLSDSTLRMDEMSLKFFMEVVGDGLSIEAIRKKHINNFVQMMKTRGVKPRSINSYLRHIRAAYNDACERYDIRPIKIKLLKVGKHLPRILTKDEIDKILKHAQKHDYEIFRIVTFALWTGCRRSEIINLRYSDIRKQYAIVKGKGNVERIVPLKIESLSVLSTWDSSNRHKIFRWYKHKDTVSKRFHAICKKLGIEGKFHNLRHSAATYMIQSGMNPKHVQSILGHQDFRTTEMYINICSEWIIEEMQKFQI